MGSTENQRRTKVLFAIDCMNIGGAPIVVYEQMKNLTHNRFDVWLLMLYGSKKANLLDRLGFLEGKVKQFHLARRSMFDIQTAVQIYRFLKKEQFDVVYTHLFLTGVVVRAVAILARVPRIVHFEHSLFTTRSWRRTLIERALSAWTYRIVVASQAVKESLVQDLSLAREKCVVIPNPVVVPERDEALLSTLKERWDMPTSMVLAIGRFSEEKGFAHLITAARYLRERHPDTHVYIVGHGPQEKKMREQVDAEGLEGYCRIITDPLHARHFLHRASVFVLPSVREGFSMVTAEALAAGVPVIASDLPAVRELVGDAATLVPPGDSTALGRALDVLLSDTAARTLHARKGKEQVSRFDMNHSIALLEEIFS